LNGEVDELRRALIEVEVSRSSGGAIERVTAWIDTAFNGEFVFPRRLIEALDLEQAAATVAILADGKNVRLESYICHVRWFGDTIAAQVIANDGSMPLLSTELLGERVLHIEYRNRRLSLD
jgi:clan AA aspartic protease